MQRVVSVFPAAAVCLFTLTAAAASAQESRHAATAAHVQDSPVLDGSLDEPAWRSAEPLVDFTQAEPAEGQPASEATEVRIAFDDAAAYVGVVCHDSNPSQIVTTDTRRDSGMGGQDSIQIIFDTFNDKQNGFVFGTNVAGAQFDGQVRDQGNANSSWDGSWDVKTTRTEHGWNAEFRIPLRTLRYEIENSLRYYVNFCHSHELAATSRLAFGTDPVEELIKLTDQITREFPNSVCFASKLIFATENFFTRWLHNQTALAIQQRLHLMGQQMVILPMKVA